jgi:hypothetical protein
MVTVDPLNVGNACLAGLNPKGGVFNRAGCTGVFLSFHDSHHNDNFLTSCQLIILGMMTVGQLVAYMGPELFITVQTYLRY